MAKASKKQLRKAVLEDVARQGGRNALRGSVAAALNPIRNDKVRGVGRTGLPAEGSKEWKQEQAFGQSTAAKLWDVEEIAQASRFDLCKALLSHTYVAADSAYAAFTGARDQRREEIDAQIKAKEITSEIGEKMKGSLSAGAARTVSVLDAIRKSLRVEKPWTIAWKEAENFSDMLNMARTAKEENGSGKADGRKAAKPYDSKGFKEKFLPSLKRLVDVGKDFDPEGDDTIAQVNRYERALKELVELGARIAAKGNVLSVPIAELSALVLGKGKVHSATVARAKRQQRKAA